MVKTALTQAKRRQWIDQGSATTKQAKEKVRKTFYIDRTAYQKLRKRAFDLETSMSKVLSGVLETSL